MSTAELHETSVFILFQAPTLVVKFAHNCQSCKTLQNRYPQNAIHEISVIPIQILADYPDKHKSLMTSSIRR